MKKYYKVVGVNSSGKKTSKTLSESVEFCLEYSTSKWTSAIPKAANDGYYPTCYKTKRYAIKSVLRYPPNCAFEIWECAVSGGIINNRKHMPQPYGLFFDNGIINAPCKHIEPFDAVVRSIRYGWKRWQPGTIMAEKIKLIRRIK